MDTGLVSGWLISLKQGDPTAAGQVWERYFARLMRLASLRLRKAKRAEADEEDVALDAFDSFFRGAAGDRFPQLSDRDDLWQVLSMIASRKAATLLERQGRRKRGAGLVLDEAALASLAADDESGGLDLDQIEGDDLDPAFLAEAAEEFRLLIEALGDETLRSIAFWKLEGYSHKEIQARLYCSMRTVSNKVELIRRIWSEREPR